jgi:AcrR family transcriptional regulator
MNPTDTKEKIIYAAFDLFFNKGYKDVSLQEISLAAGITKGGFYHYYKSKEELFIDMMNVCYFNYMNLLIQLLKDESFSFKDKLEKIMYFYYDEFASKMVSEKYEAGGFYIMLIDGLRRFEILKKRLRAMYKEIETALIQSIKKDIKSGILKNNIDPEAVIFEILAIIEGSFILWIIMGDMDVKGKMQKETNSILNRILV